MKSAEKIEKFNLNGSVSHSDEKKASEIFFDYLSPILKGIPQNVSVDKLNSILTLPVAVWNAIAMSQWGNQKDYLSIMYDKLSAASETDQGESIEIINFWANRKETLFPDEICAWDYEVFRDLKQKLRIKTKARMPRNLK